MDDVTKWSTLFLKFIFGLFSWQDSREGPDSDGWNDVQEMAWGRIKPGPPQESFWCMARQLNPRT